MSSSGFNRLLRNVARYASKIDYQKALRTGKEIAVGTGELLKQVPWSKVLKVVGIAGTAYGLGVLSMQPEVNKLKSINTETMSEIDRLKFAVKKLNDSVDIQQKKIEALKAYQFTEKAKDTENLRGCIFSQYATKEYIEIAIKRTSGNSLTLNERAYSAIFEKILNDDFTEDDAKIIENTVVPKYKSKIDNLIKFDCMSLLDKLHA